MDLIIAGIIPLKTYQNLSFPDNFNSELPRVGGVYGLINTTDSQKLNNTLVLVKIYTQYSLDHLKGRYSNRKIQNINKDGISNF